MFHLLGIDDTDGADAADTLQLALSLGLGLQSRAMAQLIHISAHPLLEHPSVHCTSTNISCCLLLDLESNQVREVEMACRETLRRDSAPGSNAGFALASWNQYDLEIVRWGRSAKKERLERQNALSLARKHGILTAGILGNGMGVIGALAAIGLRFDENDGWIDWMPGLDYLNGIYTQTQLNQSIQFDRIENEHQKRPALDDRIFIAGKLRPLMKEGKIVLPVTAAKRGEPYQWTSVSDE